MWNIEKICIILVSIFAVIQFKHGVMKKVLLGFAFFSVWSLSGLNAQSGIDIRYDPDGATGPNPVSGPNLAGSVYEMDLYASHPDLVAGTLDIHFIITNNTGNDGMWRITRKEISVPSTWIDQLCWPPNCYPTTDVIYTTPTNAIPNILNGTSTAQTGLGDLDAELKPRFTPDPAAAGYGHYRYYFNEGGTYLDSVDVKINYVLGLNSPKPAPVITIGPNPSSDQVTISLGSVTNASVKIVDVLGNVVHTDVITNGSKSLSVEDFKNGVYFVIVESPEIKTITRKLIVRH
jgi:hypothetical protein